MMHWSPQQVTGLDDAAAWLKACRSEIKAGMRLSRPIFRIFGYAGTGKTTLAKHLAGDLRGVCYAAFTGKAALMMERNGTAVTPEMWAKRKPISDLNYRWAKEQTEKNRAAYLNRKSGRGA